MPAVVVRAIEVVKAIRSGMRDSALMEEFQISARGLQALFRQLLASGLIAREELEERLNWSHGSVIVEIEKQKLPIAGAKKPRIDAADALSCIRSGMADAELMKRYNLSARGVRSLFEKLVKASLITWEEIDGRAQDQQALLLDEEDQKPPQKEGQPKEEYASEILRRLRSGTSRTEIMDTYEISRNELEELLETLVQRGVLTALELKDKLRAPLQEFAIRNRHSGEIIYSGESTSLAELVEAAVRSGIDLSGSDLSRTNLARCVLTGAQLNKSDLSGANLVAADLTGARLVEAMLAASDMTGAILYKANLASANLSDANMSSVYAVWAFLAEANLSEANLTNANFSGANLSNTQMFETILTGTIFTGAFLRTPKTE